ncbi:MAG: methionyl-tRNA formyltransferase [Minisyncoccia bacterium]
MIINNQNIKTAFMGSSEFSVIVLDNLKKAGLIPDLIVSAPDKPRGRKMVITPNEVKTWAIKNNIPVVTPDKLKNPDFLEVIKNHDLHIVASYGKIIPAGVLSSAKYGSVNIHPSLLPKYRGPSPLQTAILNNDKNTGISIMLLDAEVDHGPILAQENISPENWPVSFNELEKITAEAGTKLLIKVLPDWINNSIKAREQDHSQATFTKKVEKTHGLISLTDKPMTNLLKTKAYSEWPNTYFIVKHKDRDIRVIVKDAKLEAGQFVPTRVIPEGKKEMDYKSFLQGLK